MTKKHETLHYAEYFLLNYFLNMPKENHKKS